MSARIVLKQTVDCVNTAILAILALKMQPATVKPATPVADVLLFAKPAVRAVKVVQKSAPNAQVTAQPATAITVALTVANALTVHQMVSASAKAVCFAPTAL